MNTGYTSDVQVSAKHHTHIPEPAIYTENTDSHRHNTTPPLPSLVQAPYPLPTYITHTTAIKTQTPIQYSPCPHRIGKSQTQLSHPLTPLSTPPPRAKHIRMSHTPPTPLTTLISSTLPVLDKTPEPRVPLIHELTATTPPTDPTPALPSLSQPHTLTAHTHATQTTVHASQSPQQPHSQHRVLLQPHKQTKDYHRTTNTTQTHRHSYILSANTTHNYSIPNLDYNIMERLDRRLVKFSYNLLHTNNATVQSIVNCKLLLYPNSVLSENFKYLMSKYNLSNLD